MTDLKFEASIDASPEVVFGLLAELRHYDQWLSHSSAFHGTASISDGPIGLGTTYVEPGPLGVRHGRVTAYRRPVQLDFIQPMTLRPAFFGVIGIRLFHELKPRPGGTLVERRLELRPRGPVRLIMPLITIAFRSENVRMMARLKSVAEAEEVRSNGT